MDLCPLQEFSNPLSEAEARLQLVWKTREDREAATGRVLGCGWWFGGRKSAVLRR